MKTLILILVIATTLLIPFHGNAGSHQDTFERLNPLKANDICELIRGIVDWLIKIATPIATAMILYGAYQMLFAGGVPEKFAAGKKTILYTIIGYAIILIGWGLTSLITDILGTKGPLC